MAAVFERVCIEDNKEHEEIDRQRHQWSRIRHKAGRACHEKEYSRLGEKMLHRPGSQDKNYSKSVSR